MNPAPDIVYSNIFLTFSRINSTGAGLPACAWPLLDFKTKKIQPALFHDT